VSEQALAAVVESSSLSEAESADLGQLEAVIQEGLAQFFVVGSALLQIRERKLYRDSHPSFERYCIDRWDFSRQHAYRLIAAVGVAEHLAPGSLPAPESERQVRALTSLEPEQQQEAWAQAVEHSNGCAPTAAVVEQAAADVAYRDSSPTDLEDTDELEDAEHEPPDEPEAELEEEDKAEREAVRAEATGQALEPGDPFHLAKLRVSKDEREWLETLPLWRKLSGRCQAIYDSDAIKWYRGWVKPGLLLQLRESGLVSGGKAVAVLGHWQYQVRRLLQIEAPQKWLKCGVDGCRDGFSGAGQKCHSCRGDGYVIPGVGGN
jgi:hypothetical protein